MNHVSHIKITKLRPTLESTKGGIPHCCHSQNLCKQQRPCTSYYCRSTFISQFIICTDFNARYELDSVTEHNTVSEAAKTIIRKIDVSQIPDNFMGNVTLQRDINNTHIDITNSYSEFCNSIITEMEALLQVKYVTVTANP